MIGFSEADELAFFSLSQFEEETTEEADEGGGVGEEGGEEGEEGEVLPHDDYYVGESQLADRDEFVEEGLGVEDRAVFIEGGGGGGEHEEEDFPDDIDLDQMEQEMQDL